jgi:hypothetical protein
MSPEEIIHIRNRITDLETNLDIAHAICYEQQRIISIYNAKQKILDDDDACIVSESIAYEKEIKTLEEYINKLEDFIDYAIKNKEAAWSEYNSEMGEEE